MHIICHGTHLLLIARFPLFGGMVLLGYNVAVPSLSPSHLDDDVPFLFGIGSLLFGIQLLNLLSKSQEHDSWVFSWYTAQRNNYLR